MDFAFLPPEINSARIYAGPGSAPMLAAAGSWDSLSAELSITAEVYESVLSGLTSRHWRGPTSEAMSAAAAPYLNWLYTTAERAQQTAMQARAAAAAFELAHAMTVPPTAVAANRIQRAALIATNFFGQNTAAIAAIEAQYAEYWAQDATAMSGYAASSTATTQVTPFAEPGQTTNPVGLTAQQAAIIQAGAGSATNIPAPQAVSQSSSAAAGALPSIIPTDLTILNVIQGAGTSLSGTWKMEAVPTGVVGAENDLGMLPAPAEAASAFAPVPEGVASGVGGGAGLGNVTATLGRAGSIGSMSVPASWAAPADSPVAVLPISGSPTLPVSGEPAGTGPGMPGIPGMRPPYRATFVVPRYGVRPRMITRPLAGG